MLGVSIAHAQTVSDLVSRIAVTIVNPIITFLIALAVLVFLWGLVEYIRGAESEDVRSKGRVHMMWGLIGLFVMVSVFTILDILTDTVYQ